MMLTKQEVADRTGLSPRTIERKMRDGSIPFYRYSPRSVRFDSDDIDAYIASCRRREVPDQPRRPGQRLIWTPGMKVV